MTSVRCPCMGSRSDLLCGVGSQYKPRQQVILPRNANNPLTFPPLSSFNLRSGLYVQIRLAERVEPQRIIITSNSQLMCCYRSISRNRSPSQLQYRLGQRQSRHNVRQIPRVKINFKSGQGGVLLTLDQVELRRFAIRLLLPRKDQFSPSPCREPRHIYRR